MKEYEYVEYEYVEYVHVDCEDDEDDVHVDCEDDEDDVNAAVVTVVAVVALVDNLNLYNSKFCCVLR